MAENKYYGKYRGRVVAVDTTGGMYRIRAEVPKLLDGYTTGWALPCLNFSFDEAMVGWDITVGDLVWIEFEQGNIDLPVWSGGWFTKGKAPSFKGIKINGTLLEFLDSSIKVHGDLTVTGGISRGHGISYDSNLEEIIVPDELSE